MKLTANGLRQLVKEELGKFGKVRNVKDVVKTVKEVPADGYADTLAKQIDQMKALKIEESKLKSRLAVIAERKAQLMKLIVNS
jgi:tRNA isopentenyl-2-thiomethyl-A-37 hydroxylase MiaE